MADTIIEINTNANPARALIPASGIGAVILWEAGTTWSEVVAKLPDPSTGEAAIIYVHDPTGAGGLSMDAPANLDNVLIMADIITAVGIDPGFSLLGSTLNTRNINLVFNTTAYTGAGPADGINICCDGGGIYAASNASPVLFHLTAATIVTLDVGNGAQIGGNSSVGQASMPIFQFDAAPTIGLVAHGSAVLFDNLTTGAGAATASVAITYDCSAQINTGAFNAAATYTWTRNGDGRTTTVKTAAYSAQPGEIVLCDPTGGVFTINLPKASLVGAGAVIVVKVQSDSNNGVTLTPNAADTVDGVGGATAILYARGAIKVVSDGVSDWMQVP